MPKKRPSAADVIADLEKSGVGAVASAGSDFFGIMSGKAATPGPMTTVVVPLTQEVAEDAVKLLGACMPTFTPEEAKVVLELVPGAHHVNEIITHPVFIRAAAQRGLCFVPGKKKIERQWSGSSRPEGRSS
jgi:hypothetical protein